MAHLVANTTPASAAGFTWDHPEHVVEIEDPVLANELLHIAGQFSEVLPTDPRHPRYGEELSDEDESPSVDPEDAAALDDLSAAADDTAQAHDELDQATSRRTRTRRTPITE